jgi:uncharacterized phage protein gp47/JayE
MADEELPGVIETFTRDEYRNLYLQDYQLFVPDADVGPGTQPYVDGSLAADSTQVLVNDAIVIGNGTNLDDSEGRWLQQTGESEGVFKLPPAGGSGYIEITTATGGSAIFQGDQVREPLSGLRFQVMQTQTYGDGALVPIAGIDTGEETNLPAGTSVEFTTPRPGCSPIATVYEQSNGEGLTGGRGQETDDEYRARIKLKRANPPASGNDAEYQQVIEKIPNIGVQKAFTYPAIFGPGTMGFTFTLRPSQPGAGRVPNGAQLALAFATLQGREPGDDGIFGIVMVETPLVVVCRVTWASGAANWVDEPQWPPYTSMTTKVVVAGAPAPTPTTCRLTKAGATITDPQEGQTIGFFDREAGLFRRKRIESVTIVTPGKIWDLVFSTAALASDTTYTPIAGQGPSPWSDSLDLVVAPTLLFVDGLGPGEMFSSFFDPGLRQRRSPANPDSYPSTITNKLISPILALPSISNAVLLEPDVPTNTPVGTPGSLVYLFALTDVSVFGD